MTLISKRGSSLAVITALVLLGASGPVAAAQVSGAAVSPTPVASAPGPHYEEFRGVRLGMTADEARERLGKPKDRDDAMDYYEFSDSQRARVYYDADKRVEAIIATYIGAEGGAPAPEAILGTAVEFASDGSGAKKIDYPAAGYWVAYSRTAGDQPFVMITMKKM